MPIMDFESDNELLDGRRRSFRSKILSPKSVWSRAILMVCYTSLVIMCSITGSMYFTQSMSQSPQSMSQSSAGEFPPLSHEVQYLMKALPSTLPSSPSTSPSPSPPAYSSDDKLSLDDKLAEYIDKRVARLVQSPSRNLYQKIDSSQYPRRAYATLTSLDPIYCRATYHLYRSIERTEAKHWQQQDDLAKQSNGPSVYRSRVDRQFDFIIMFVEGTQNQTNLFTDPYCSLLTKYAYTESLNHTLYDAMKHTIKSDTLPHLGRVRYLTVPSAQHWIDKYPKLSINQSNWVYALSKIHILSHSEYEKVFFIDSDAIVAKPIVYLFDRVDDLDLVVAMDTWHCNQQTFMNGGVWLARPSKLLFDSFLSYMRLEDNNVCLSGKMNEPVNELVNCVCGNWKAGLSRRPAVKCDFAPWYLDTFPQYTKCPDYQAPLVEILHVAGRPKPWDKYATDCKHTEDLYVGALTSSDHKFFTDRPACFTGMESLQTYYQCVSYWQSKGATMNDVAVEETASRCAIVAL